MERIQEISLAKIVMLKPAAAPILEKYNLDFCCGGKQLLSKALADNPEKLKIVTNELNLLFNNEVKDPEIDFSQMSLSDLILYILNTHHHFVRTNIPLIEMHLKKVSEKHGEHHPSVVKIADLFNKVKQELELHMVKEEEVLFPRIKAIENAYNYDKGNIEMHIQAPIQMMEHEHEAVGSLMDEIRKLSWNFSPPIGACTTFLLSFSELKLFEEDLHIHIHLENNILFPRALEMQRALGGIILN